jgi:hypothetical protein
MNGEYLRVTALRCFAVAQECSDDGSKRKLIKIAEELLCKANEVDGSTVPITTLKIDPDKLKGVENQA